MQVKVIVDKGGYLPQKAHRFDAGYDIRTPERIVVAPGVGVSVGTKVRMLIPDGYVGFLKSKSGLNVRDGIVSEGVIDAGYTAEIVVKLYNHGLGTKEFEKGDKITQIVILPIPDTELTPCTYFPETDRGDNGFGSSGR